MVIQQVIIDAQNLRSEGKFNQAKNLLEKTLENSANFYQGWLLLSRILYDLKAMQEAMDYSKKAEQLDPLQHDFQLIQQCMHKNALNDAISIAYRMLQKVPNHPRAIYTLAHIASKQHNHKQSVLVLQEGVEHSPANLILRNMLTQSYTAAGYYENAISNAKETVNLSETYETLWQLIGLLQKYAQYEDLLTSCKKIEKFTYKDNAKHSQVELVRGQALRILGRREESIAAFKNSLSFNPLNSDAWWALADMKNYPFNETEIEALDSLINQPNLNNRTKCIALFAQAKARENLNENNTDLSIYHHANKLALTGPYNPNNMTREFEARMQAYSNQNLHIQAAKSENPLVPIFIVGLPRSGSTLVEQMLASHPLIEGTIEQPTLANVESQAQAFCMQQHKASLLSALAILTPEELAQFGHDYLDNGALFRSLGCDYFIDKQPFNFRLIGFIHKILPQAKIIDVRRNPLDCGLSLYKQFFHSGVDFSYDLKNIGAAFNAYVTLMNHWHDQLPGKVLQVQYESLIQEPEVQIKHILKKIGLNFDSQCLNFYKTQRSIHTASSEQVRQPINKKGIGTWRPVESQITELISSLGENTLSQYKYLS